MRLALCVLLTAIVVSGVNAEWDDWDAEPQPSQVFKEFGRDKDNLRTVNASAIEDALKKHEEIQLKYAKIKGDVEFHGEAIKDVCFFYCEFLGETDFSGATFSGVANFGDAIFSRGADFIDATFLGKADFRGVSFSGLVNSIFARLSGDADFSRADFSGETDFDITTFLGNAYFTSTRFFKDLYLDLAVFEGSGSLSLGYSVYPNIYVGLPDDPNKVSEFLNNPFEDTYLRLLKNQKDLGRPHKSLYVAMKRHQRGQKILPFRLLERCLFDCPTQYGTASFPPTGVLICMGLFLGGFTAIYYFINRHLRSSRSIEILEYHSADGGEAECQRKLDISKIIWFSLNTFIPAVQFINVQHWRIRDDLLIGKRFVKIKCSTLATVESILGWLLIPILLRYFRL